MKFEVDAWMDELRDELLCKFGDKLALLGLQGSRARGEARQDSDIDVVLVIDGLEFSTLEEYKGLVSRMPHGYLACGFVGSPKVLASWPRYDSFNLVMDTTVYYGSFDFMDADYSSDDALDAARSGASTIYHAVCHGALFDGDALADIVANCAKSAFFVMRALAYARTGEYPATRARMRELASEDEAALLCAYDQPDSTSCEVLAKRLLRWSAAVLEGN